MQHKPNCVKRFYAILKTPLWRVFPRNYMRQDWNTKPPVVKTISLLPQSLDRYPKTE